MPLMLQFLNDFKLGSPCKHPLSCSRAQRNQDAPAIESLLTVTCGTIIQRSPQSPIGAHGLRRQDLQHCAGRRSTVRPCSSRRGLRGPRSQTPSWVSWPAAPRGTCSTRRGLTVSGWVPLPAAPGTSRGMLLGARLPVMRSRVDSASVDR
jgi:hypothetical protein